ncbi:MAG: hypothetical protein IJK41_04350 [Muribaculaceae bacterium]|nr:hypothetical protein [Muribaculaceae bacterium]
MKKIIAFLLVLLPLFTYAEKVIMGPATIVTNNSKEMVLKNLMFRFEEDSYDYITDKNSPYIGLFWSDNGGDVNNTKIFNSRIVTKGIGRFVKLEDSTIGIIPVYKYLMITESTFTIIYLIGATAIRIEEFGADNTGHINENDRKLFIYIDHDDFDVDQFIKLRDMLNKAAKIIN